MPLLTRSLSRVSDSVFAQFAVVAAPNRLLSGRGALIGCLVVSEVTLVGVTLLQEEVLSLIFEAVGLGREFNQQLFVLFFFFLGCAVVLLVHQAL